MRIRIFADIELPDFDTEAPEGLPKTWDWHHILNLGPQEQIWIYGAERQELEVKEKDTTWHTMSPIVLPPPKNDAGTIRTW